MKLKLLFKKKSTVGGTSEVRYFMEDISGKTFHGSSLKEKNIKLSNLISGINIDAMYLL